MTGARLRKIRRLGTPLPGLTRKEPRRTGDPHGGARRRRVSDYRVRLEEKQKVRWHYGISETQMRGAFSEASRLTGPTGDNLLALLERRLDNAVFRLGLAPTIPAARQLVAHGHVRVDGQRTDRPAFRVAPGQEISLSARARAMPDVVASTEHGPQVRLPGYLALASGDPFRGRVIGSPTRTDVPFLVEVDAIVEFYAR